MFLNAENIFKTLIYFKLVLELKLLVLVSMKHTNVFDFKIHFTILTLLII